MKKSKILGVLILALMLTISSTTVFAVEEVTEPGEGTTLVALTAEATRFSVTVPMALPVTVDANGVVTTPTVAKIVNNSYGKVKVTDVAITGNGGWDIVSFDTDMTKVAVNKKQIGFKLNGDVTTGETLDFAPGSYNVMDGENVNNTNEISLAYDAVIPAQSEAITAETVASVVFTFAWDN